MLKATADEVATREVEAPVGPLGLELANSNSGVVVVKSLSGSSPLHLIVGVGWHLVSVDGASVSTFSEAVQLLQANAKRKRALRFLDPEARLDHLRGSPWKEQRGEVTVVAPAGKLGMRLRTQGGGPVVQSLFAASPLVRSVAPGWRLLSLDGKDVSSMSHDDVVALLMASADKPKRSLVFFAPTPPPTTRSLSSLILAAAPKLAALVALLALLFAISPQALHPVVEGVVAFVDDLRASHDITYMRKPATETCSADPEIRASARAALAAAPKQPSAKAVTSLSERDRLMRGLPPPAELAKPKCADEASAECALSVSEATCAEQTAEGERWRVTCCRTCHHLTCRDLEPQCEEWANSHRCVEEPDLMRERCCRSCSPSPDNPCAIDPSARPDVYKGDIERIFRRIVEQHAPTGGSAPELPRRPVVLSTDPWIVRLDDFLSEDECAQLISAIGGASGEFLRPSATARSVRQADGSVVLRDLEHESRTSYNAWCHHPGCYDAPVHDTVLERIMGLLGLPPNNAEQMQLLRYREGEFYRVHHDFLTEQQHAACGPRVFTFFLYLSDVQEGGETRFPLLDNLTVRPKRGTALLWAHGLSLDPSLKDERTQHEALPVLAGTKYAANVWVHGRDFKRAMSMGCDGRQGSSHGNK